MNKMRYLRIALALVVLALAFTAVFFHGDVGTLCLLCPVGFGEVALASGSIPWALLPGVLIVLVLIVLLGRVFCSWVCPTSLLRNIFGGHKPRGLTGRVGETPGCSTCGRPHNNLAAQAVVLGVLLIISFIVHFPVFCLICPIGLTFGALFALSRTLITWQPGWELVVFPAMLILEVLVLRRWCSAICPLGFFFGLMAKLHVRLPGAPKPRVQESACRYEQGCRVCEQSCAENICAASATPATLEDCTGCLDCKEHCPTQAIHFLGRESGSSEAKEQESER